MGDRAVDIALAILQAAIAIAGLTLVYSGFLIGKAGSFQGSVRGDKLLVLARLALVPVLLGFFVSALAERVLVPSQWGSVWASSHLLPMFLILLAITGIYAILGAFMGT